MDLGFWVLDCNFDESANLLELGLGVWRSLLPDTFRGAGLAGVLMGLLRVGFSRPSFVGEESDCFCDRSLDLPFSVS